ncbi:DUF6889 family protein [Salinarimonas soli]|uniref:DUF6889 family protein n=1 Tax=Salinarimonas soli TaxID=1638099 RepID=UPI0016619A32|nr:hypothetical protein [Salinarimonas soli]
MTLPDDMGWLLRPVSRGHAKLHELSDGTYTLCDIALLNDMLDVEDENAFRAQEAAKR